MDRRYLHRDIDSYDTRQAKQRASIKWLLSKAHNNKVPDEVKEPFYRDHEDQDHLKPQIVRDLANATLYCLAFANIYSDPNYNNLNHTGVLQTLARKGVTIPEVPASDGPLTETVLIQTTPIKLAAHIAVIEAIMTLYAKEVVTPDRVVAAIQRFTNGFTVPPLPADPEKGLLLWITQSQQALTQRLFHEHPSEPPLQLPEPRDVTALNDGVGLATLIAFYCPEELPWREIRVSAVRSVADSVHNLCLVHEFCHHSLPMNVFHMMPEDVTYLQGCMRVNLIVLLADLFNVLEIHPVKCVRFPGREVPKPINNSAIRKSFSSPHADSYFRGSPDSLDRLPDDRRNDESFVIHRSRGVPTLSSIAGEDPLIPARLRPNKERTNSDNKSEERGEAAAGKPSHWDDQKRMYSGRRSRRNSLTDDSQLTLENFGGSQENLHFLGRNPDKSPAVLPPGSHQNPVSPPPTRTSAQDARSAGVELIFAANAAAMAAAAARSPPLPASPPPPVVQRTEPIRSTREDARGTAIEGLFAGMEAEKDDKVDGDISVKLKDPFDSNRAKSPGKGADEQKTTTTWQQQQKINLSSLNESQNLNDEAYSSMQLHNIRLKLEERRRHIETEKKQLEFLVNKQRQKVGKAAFLQAVSKDKNKESELQKNKTQGDCTSLNQASEEASYNRTWMDSRVPHPDEPKTPDFDNVDLEGYQRSIAQMNTSLSEIESDMRSLSLHSNDFDISQPSKSVQKMNSTNYRLFNNHSANNNITGRQSSMSNQTVTLSSSPPPSKISLSQLHHQQQNQAQQQQTGHFYLHEQPVRRTWSARAALTSWKQQQQLSSSPPPSAEPSYQSPLINGSSASPTPLPMPRAQRPSVPPKPQPVARKMREPEVDDMAPQDISFIGDAADDAVNMSRINITSGSRTYRIPSPTRPNSAKHAFTVNNKNSENVHPEDSAMADNKKTGFYIAFDDVTTAPKRPKPPLRTKRSPKKVIEGRLENADEFDERLETAKAPTINRVQYSPEQNIKASGESSSFSVISKSEYSPDTGGQLNSSKFQRLDETPRFQPVKRVQEIATPGVGLVIGSEPDPNAMDEMERRKEMIVRKSLQRRQLHEEEKARKEMETQQRKELEKIKEEDRARKKEEEKQRRAAILEQHRLKKAIEEADREGKVLDKSELLKLAAPKLRNKPAASTAMRPRPKTIHIENSTLDSTMHMTSPQMPSSRGNRGSSTNLQDRSSHETSVFTRPLRRDYYRGSQDSLAGSTGTTSRRGHRESPGEQPSRGTSPSRTHVMRRGSYKNSRDSSEPPQNRGRPTYSTYQSNFKGRKSNSLMNLCGSSSDQDNFAGYRYTDTDSGLGRATPPRRAASPGSYGRQHLTYPSVGPGSLPPGLTTKRGIFDDGASDISSSASSMMEYNGPRLYKKPATKSNRGIMLNAVEYCVFPGVVNKEQKQKVLEEISRSESKHFLILFRDAGCQFRALYAYYPESEEVIKLYGTGPKMVTDRMFDRFFKYNSGGKCFSQVHTKHLTVTIDAFTIHNSLWQGKKVNLPSKKDMALVI